MLLNPVSMVIVPSNAVMSLGWKYAARERTCVRSRQADRAGAGDRVGERVTRRSVIDCQDSAIDRYRAAANAAGIGHIERARIDRVPL